MIPDGEYTAVVDRIEDGLAALEVSDDEDRHELTIDVTGLPEPARQADAVLKIELQDGDLVEVQFDSEETETRKEQAQTRFDRLSRRPPSKQDVDEPDDAA